MKNKILAIILAFVGLFSLIATPVYAEPTPNTDICNNDKIAKEIKQAAGCDNTASASNIENVIQNIINVILGILGVVCFVIIVIGGVQYMTSTGEAAKTQRAKNTILYAVIGLIICALAGVITNFTINIIEQNNKNQAKTTCPEGQTLQADNTCK